MRLDSQEIVREMKELVASLGLSQDIRLWEPGSGDGEGDGGLSQELMGWEVVRANLILRWHTGGHDPDGGDAATLELLDQNAVPLVSLVYTQANEDHADKYMWACVCIEKGDFPEDMPEEMDDKMGQDFEFLMHALYQGELGEMTQYETGLNLVTKLGEIFLKYTEG